MELKKKSELIMKAGGAQNDDLLTDIDRRVRQQEDRENVMFLLPQYRDRLLKQQKDETSDSTGLQKKLDSKQM